jgi:hypothetical protein
MAATMNPTFNPTSLDEEAQDTMIEIIVNGKSFNVNKSVVSASTFIKDTLEFSGEATIAFSLPDKVKNPQQTMEWVLHYLQYHAQHPVSQITLPLVSDDLKESGVGDWDIAFISKSDPDIVALSISAHYLHIPDLQTLCCAKIGSIMKRIVKQYTTKQEQIDAVKRHWTAV